MFAWAIQRRLGLLLLTLACACKAPPSEPAAELPRDAPASVAPSQIPPKAAQARPPEARPASKPPSPLAGRMVGKLKAVHLDSKVSSDGSLSPGSSTVIEGLVGSAKLWVAFDWGPLGHPDPAEPERVEGNGQARLLLPRGEDALALAQALAKALESVVGVLPPQAVPKRGWDLSCSAHLYGLDLHRQEAQCFAGSGGGWTSTRIVCPKVGDFEVAFFLNYNEKERELELRLARFDRPAQVVMALAAGESK